MLGLDRNSRAALAGAGLISIAAALATMPSAARGEAASNALDGRMVTVARPAARRVPSATPAAFARVIPRRDPFAGGPPSVRAAIATPARSAAFEAPPAQLPAMPTAPPVAAPPVAAAPRVTAIVTGTHPSALIDDAGATRIVTVGEFVAGERVAAIRIDGVHLVNGTTLPVAPYLASPHGER